MSTKPYTPRKGSIPGQAVDHLRQHGSPLSSAELAELLDQPIMSLPPLLQGARAGGALINYQRRGHGLLRWWRLPDMPAHDDALPDVDQLERDALLAQQAKGHDPMPIRQLTVKTSTCSWHPPVAIDKPQVAGLRVAAWSSGELAIETDEHVIVFKPDEARAVIALVRALPVAA